jgi:hypothetical protein
MVTKLGGSALLIAYKNPLQEKILNQFHPSLFSKTYFTKERC